ncbi:IS1182 family transposase [Cellvibrio sp. KY-GH-1]|uniref:IS1182 family transposase n=1 Tax=Cellvibrio sp. KY-GH-1 TaxID=2303332 RepID=UPI001CD99A48|nr:IS1182 family transposase [Cellvibrio sp. KY-GH-1]
MLKEPAPRQHTLEMVILEDLVPADHLLRKIDKYINFEFIRDQVRHLYCDNNGRPAVDPVLLFKMLFIGYLFGVRSERQLVREVQVNVAYRWFLGLSLTDKIIDASTFSQQRRRRFLATDIEQQIFDEIVRQAIGHGLVGGDVLYTDSTHMKANANKKKFEIHTVTQTPTDYLTALEVAIDEDRIANGKAPLKEKAGDTEPKTRDIKVSTTDPDSGYLTREGKPKGFYYLDHRTVDGKYNIITDTHVTPGNVHDSKPYLARLDRQLTAFNIYPYTVGLDAGYKTAGICKGLEDRNIEGVIGYRRPNKAEGLFARRKFVFDADQNHYTCPAGQLISYNTTNRLGYREYRSDSEQCKRCPFLDQCTRSRNHTKVITRHVWQDSVERADARRLTEQGKRIYQRRKETVERSFADAKQLHGHRYARYRGLRRVSGQCLLAAACQNMKKIALLLARFYNPLVVLGLVQALWILISRFIEKNERIGNQSPEMRLMHSAS